MLTFKKCNTRPRRRVPIERTILGSLPLLAVAAALTGATLAAPSASSPASENLGRPSQQAAAFDLATRARRHAALTMHIRARVTLATRTEYRLEGAVSPPRVGERVRIQLRTATGWHTIATVALRKGSVTHSRFRITLRNPTPGIYRARLVHTPRYYAASSIVLAVGVSEVALAPAVNAAFAQEHVAAATYANVVARLGQVQPFPNILSAEDQHIATVEQLARTYAISLPTGPFTGDPAPATRAEACALGVAVEQSTIALYDRLLPTVTTYPNVTRAFQNLRTAALDSHLPAFQQCATAGGTGSTGSSGSSSGSVVVSDPVALAPALTAAFAQEHVAAATYANVVARLGQVQPFPNILSAEDQHIATVEQLARTYAISLPTGPFTGDPAPATRAEACALGVAVEQSTIALYDRLLPTVTTYPNVTRAFQNLRTAALDSHLPAFQRCS